ncbi:MAG: Maf family nucleotide pyrophosphatase [Bacteroidales bacterium]|nr:Maf family nucleotide pyrophosphatase [Bacteroidales bacterium]
MKDKLKKYNIILASGSPRRRELMQMLGLDFTVKTKPTDEVYPDTLPVEEVSEYLSRLKAGAFREEAQADKSLMVIASDTTVAVDGEILGKPADRADAIAMLRKLSGKSHSVFSGVCIMTADRTESFTARTDVWFRELQDQEIEFYVDNYKPFDKAGAYAVQEWIGAAAISRMEGSYYNVVGLPTQMLYVKLCGW